MIQNVLPSRSEFVLYRVFAPLMIVALCGHATPAQTGVAAPSRPWQFAPEPIEKGFLFIDGRYVSPPYEIKLTRESICINGEEFRKDDFDLTYYEDDFPVMNGRPAVGMMRINEMRRFRPPVRFRGTDRMTPLEKLSGDILFMSVGNVVVLYRDHHPLVLRPTGEGHDLLKTLCSINPAADASSSAPSTLSSEVDRQSWEQLVSDFEPTTEFLSRASQFVSGQETIFAENENQLNASVWRDRVGFPLTIFASVVVVLAFGHLLSSAPRLGDNQQDQGLDPNARRTIIHSLAFIALLSVVDLVWTLLAYQAGAMRELNPLGSGLIAEPSKLVLFKFTVTATAIGLLYWLHPSQLAQRASWWCCLVLTLLAARWLTFQSMFL